MQDPYERQKESTGGLATIVFLISAFYLFVSDGGFASLFSLKALGFFVIVIVTFVVTKEAYRWFIM